MQGGCNGADTGHNGYGDNLHCVKTIQAPAGNTIELTFTHLVIEPPPIGADTLSVYDGPSDLSPLIGAYTGTDIPAAVESTGNTLTLVFTTDTGNYGLNHVGSGSGFTTNGVAGSCDADECGASVSDDPGFYADCAHVQPNRTKR